MLKFRSLAHGLAPTLLALGAVCSPAAMAQDAYPDRPIRVVVPFPAGGGVDVITRLLGQEMTGTLGQPLVIENRPGAGTLVGASAVASSPADGYTMMAVTVDTLTVASSLQKSPVTIPEETLQPITQIVRTPLLLAVRPDSPYQTLDDLIEAARAQPEGLVYGSAGVGTLHHLGMELLTDKAGVSMRHVPYRGSAPMLADLIGGRVDVGMLESPLALPQLAGGKLRALAVTTAQRSPMAPSVPTVAEQGYPDYAAFSWMGFAVPRGTGEPVVARLHQAIAGAVAAPNVGKGLRDMGLEPYTSESPAAFEQFAATERERWVGIIKERGIVLE